MTISSVGAGSTSQTVDGNQANAQIYAASSTGNDTYAITLSPVPAGYTNGMLINFKADVANTGAATLNVNGLGAIAINKFNDEALATGDIEANQIVTVVYNSTGPKFQMQSQLSTIPGRLTSFQVLTSGAAATYTKPAGITAIWVECLGGGGAGGGATTTGVTLTASGGGGSGGYCRKWITSAAASYTYTIGAGGTGVAGAAGNNGAATTFTDGGSVNMSAGGGTGGGESQVLAAAGPQSTGGTGGTASGGDINMPGICGGFGEVNTGWGALGGVGAPSFFAGSPNSATVVGVTGSANGNASGANTGAGGGGGAGNADAAANTGGNGGSGVIIVWEFT